MPKPNALADFALVNTLLDTYGALLTTHQAAVMSDYYRFNLSLQEIAEQRNVSRAAISDTLKQAKQSLTHYEKVLGLVHTNVSLLNIIEDPLTPIKIKGQLKKLLDRKGR
ncbi:MAG: hypothetical protein ACO3QN_04325, partial [Bacilli bacterium]